MDNEQLDNTGHSTHMIVEYNMLCIYPLNHDLSTMLCVKLSYLLATTCIIDTQKSRLNQMAKLH